MKSKSEYWFPAKRYGWGWGLPMRWQGWLIFAVYLVALILGSFYFSPEKFPMAFISYVVILSTLLVAICWLKGEPPKWRWGNENDPKA